MTTSMDSTNPILVTFNDYNIECTDLVLNKDRHAITISMSMKNIGQANVLISVNNFCLIHNGIESYAQHCYINDGQSFEVISGWKSLSREKSYTLIMKYVTNPNLSTFDLCYRSMDEQYRITSFIC